MGKREQKQARTDIAAEKTRIQGQTDKFMSGLDPERAQARERFNTGYEDLTKRYSGLADTGGFDPEQTASLRKGFGTLATTGGYDQSVADRLGASYRNFSTTGGYSPTDIYNIRARGASAIPAVYNRLQEGLRQQQALQGGYSPGFTAATAKLGRQAAESTAQEARNTEIDIADRLRQGKLVGLQGQQGLQESLRQGRLAGLSGSQGFEESLRAGRLGGIGGLQQLMGLALNETGQIDAKKLQAMGLNAGQIAQMMDMQRQLSMTPGIFDNIIRGVGAAAGLASALTPTGAASRVAGMGGGGGSGLGPGVGN